MHRFSERPDDDLDFELPPFELPPFDLDDGHYEDLEAGLDRLNRQFREALERLDLEGYLFQGEGPSC